jgi:hypothetical protein
MLWVPLFENSDNSEETTRNVAAACLGKLATTHPSRYLPQLHVRDYALVCYDAFFDRSNLSRLVSRIRMLPLGPPS